MQANIDSVQNLVDAALFPSDMGLQDCLFSGPKPETEAPTRTTPVEPLPSTTEPSPLEEEQPDDGGDCVPGKVCPL